MTKNPIQIVLFLVNLFFTVNIFWLDDGMVWYRKLFYLTNLSQIQTTLFHYRAMVIPKKSLSDYKKHYFNVYTLSLFVLLAFWILFAIEPLLVMRNIDLWNKFKIHIVYIHGLNTVTLHYYIDEFGLAQYIQKNKSSFTYTARLWDLCSIIVIYILMTIFHKFSFGTYVYPFMNIMSLP